MPTITGSLNKDQKRYVRKYKQLPPRTLAIDLETAQEYVEDYLTQLGWVKPSRPSSRVTNETTEALHIRIDREYSKLFLN